MLASFLIRYHTRRIDNVLQTLRFLERWHPAVVAESEVILMCQNRCGELSTRFAKTSNFNMELPEMMMAKQLNFGVEKAISENIVLLDGDRILPMGYFDRALRELLVLKTMITTQRMWRLSFFLPDEDIAGGSPAGVEEWRSTNNQPLTRNIFSGNVAFKKSDFYEAGGADEGYVGYGWEDHDMAQRMTAIGVKSIFTPDLEYHLKHEGQTYGVGDPDKLFVQNGLRYCKKWKVPYPEGLRVRMKKFYGAI